jgi:mannose-6-phosphate isomerase-like protein (cupin superfamily)
LFDLFSDFLSVTLPLTEERPWGAYTVLIDAPHMKVKQLWVKPGHRLSLQLHHQREEHWIVTQGVAEVTVDDTVQTIPTGTYIHIPRESKHRLANPGTEMLEILEVQQGTYFGEDDIVRFADDYQRC